MPNHGLVYLFPEEKIHKEKKNRGPSLYRDVFRIIHRKLKFGGDIWGGFVPYYIPEGGCVPYFFPDRRFYSG